MKLGDPPVGDADRPVPDGSGLRVALVVARFNGSITQRLLEGARQCLQVHGVAEGNVTVVPVPGAWEVPQAAAWLLERGEVDAIVTLGCLIRGETDHYDVLAASVSASLAALARGGRVPISFGMLTVREERHARERAGGRVGNQGYDAALAALEMAALIKRRG